MSDKSFIIRNVHLFDGEEAKDGLWTVVTKADLIHRIIREGCYVDANDDVYGMQAKAPDTQVINGRGGWLLPGFIDANCHITNEVNLRKCVQHGVTTALDMGCYPPSLLNALRYLCSLHPTLPTLLSPGIPAASPNTFASDRERRSNVYHRDLHNEEDAAEFVADRIKQGVDYIKFMSDPDGLCMEVMEKLVTEARRCKLKSIAQAWSYEGFVQALDADVDIVMHLPLADRAIEKGETLVARMRLCRKVCVPTFGRVESNCRDRATLKIARQSVQALIAAGIDVLVGSCATNSKYTPQFGKSYSHEMLLLTRCGMVTESVLRSATSLAAEVFGLTDRGVIKKGYRADMVLLDEDPIDDIEATEHVERVWVGGIEVPIDDKEARAPDGRVWVGGLEVRKQL